MGTRSIGTAVGPTRRFGLGAVDGAGDGAAPAVGQSGSPLVVTADLDLLDSILAAAAAAGVEPTVTAEPGSVRPQWSVAPMVVIGADQAQRMAEQVLPHRREVFLVARDEQVGSLSGWSLPLRATVVGLPGGAGPLTAAIADVAGRPTGSGRVIAVIGGSGGVGSSSVAAALAVVGAARGWPAMLVDLDPLGGGIDLLVGAESVPGWRWPRLSGAQGHLGDLTGHLPRLAGVDVLSTARDVETEAGSAADAPRADAVAAVLMSATRSHRLVVVDLPRRIDAVAAEALRHADLTLLVALADVRGIAAGQQSAGMLRPATGEIGLVVRRPRVGGIAAPLVAEALQLRLSGVVGEDAALRRGAERGDPPGRTARSPMAKLAGRLLDELLAREAA